MTGSPSIQSRSRVENKICMEWMTRNISALGALTKWPSRNEISIRGNISDPDGKLFGKNNSWNGHKNGCYVHSGICLFVDFYFITVVHTVPYTVPKFTLAVRIIISFLIAQICLDRWICTTRAAVLCVSLVVNHVFSPAWQLSLEIRDGICRSSEEKELTGRRKAGKLKAESIIIVYKCAIGSDNNTNLGSSRSVERWRGWICLIMNVIAKFKVKKICTTSYNLYVSHYRRA